MANSFGSILKELRRSEKETQQELATALGVSRSTISMYESELREPNFETLEAVADHYNVDMNFLTGWTDDPYDYDTDPDNRMDAIPSAIFEHLSEIYDDNAAIWKAYLTMEDNAQYESYTNAPKQNPDNIPKGFEPLPKMRKVPLVGSIACGVPILAEENIEEYVDIKDNVQADFALRCKGDSMIGAGVHSGDLVFIRKTREIPQNGKIVAVRIDTEATLKRWFKNNNVVQLIAENPDVPPMVFVGEQLNEIQIEGVAVGFTHMFK